MRRAVIAALIVLLLPMVGSSQIRISSGTAGLTSSGTAITSTVPILLADGTAAAPSLAIASDSNTGFYFSPGAGYLAYSYNGTERAAFAEASGLYFNSSFRVGWCPGAPTAGSCDLFLSRDATAVLGLRNSTNAQRLNVYNSFTTYGSNYGAFSIDATATGTDLIGTGAGATAATGAFRSLQGGVSKTIVDAAAAVSFVRIAVPTGTSIGGDVIYTASSTDGTAPLTRQARWSFAGADTAGTVTCGVGAEVGAATAYSRGNTLVCTMTAVTATTNCDLQITCTDNLAAAQTVTFRWRLDMPIPATVTPQ